METPKLSAEQRALLGRSIRVVEAGPGSGKTRALVARFLTSAASSHKGVAIVSFTNAAVDEVRSRAYQAPRLLRAPHFVGTIDSFLHRFIVTPAETPRLGRLPTYWPSWDDLPEKWSIVRLSNLPGSGIRLSCFRINVAGVTLLDEPALRWQEAAYLMQVDKAGRQQNLLARAKSMITALTRNGTYDSSAARLKAEKLLSNAEGPKILSRISRRFNELLVDEAQDCDEAEFEIIRRIADTGVTTLVVADPDQAIYEFRGGSPQLFLEYRDSYEPSAFVKLETNYRSTRSICSAITALRSAGYINSYSQSKCAPVFILGGGPDDQRVKFLATLTENEVAIQNAIVLAHRRDDAIQVTGQSLIPTRDAIGDRLIAACSIICDSENPSQRLAAMQAIERMILGLLDWPEGLRTCSQAQRLEVLDRNSEWLRWTASCLVTRVATATDADSFGAAARRQLKTELERLPISLLPLQHWVKKPHPATWAAYREKSSNAKEVLVGSTVHSAKGMEFDAVLLALPANLRKTNGLDVLDECSQDLNREARRVLYVGASRAKRVLAIGAGPHVDRVESIMRERDVPIELR